MNSIRDIVEARGGWDRLVEGHPVRVEAGEGLLPLVIGYQGEGRRGGTLVSIAHYREQDGDLLADPELVVEVLFPAGWWMPLSYQQDSLRIYREAVSVEGEGLVVRSRVVDELGEF